MALKSVSHFSQTFKDRVNPVCVSHQCGGQQAASPGPERGRQPWSTGPLGSAEDPPHTPTRTLTGRSPHHRPRPQSPSHLAPTGGRHHGPCQNWKVLFHLYDRRKGKGIFLIRMRLPVCLLSWNRCLWLCSTFKVWNNFPLYWKLPPRAHHRLGWFCHVCVCACVRVCMHLCMVTTGTNWNNQSVLLTEKNM